MVTASKPLRIIFMGTPEFSVGALNTLRGAGHDIICVYSQPPRPANRGHAVQKSAVHQAAEAHGIEVRTPLSLKVPEEQKAFADLNADVAVVVAYGLLLPKPVLDAPRYGCINIHASLLPRWRGAAPIQRAILAGDADSGITIMQMDVGLDTGAMWLKRSVPITTQTTAGALHDELSKLGAEMIVEALPQIASGSIKPIPQPEAGVTYATKLTKDEGRINWQESAAEIERKLRGLSPWPGVYFESKGERIKVLEAAVVFGMHGAAGTLLKDDFTVACGEDAITLTKVQRQGRSATDGASFLRGFSVKVGELL
ncbi:MAG: methionyl-tRNA formyltransferase [Alphaproteobacteria bacterium]|nr:methionyl-tRNA formyltransferase [Alphaproteobacteria bacterium]